MRQYRYAAMKRVKLLSLLAIVITLGPQALSQNRRTREPSTPRDLPATEIARRVLPSVVLLTCDNRKETSQGSGVFVAPDLVITSLHVVQGMKRGTIQTVAGRRQKFRISHVLQTDDTSDLALLGVVDATRAQISPLPVRATKTLDVGQTIYAFGNPEGLAGTMSPGIVSAGLRKFKHATLLQISAPISPGSSGGPVVDSQAQLVGIAHGGLKDSQNLNFAVPVSVIKQFLDRWYADSGTVLLWAGLVNSRDTPADEWVWLASEQTNAATAGADDPISGEWTGNSVSFGSKIYDQKRDTWKDGPNITNPISFHLALDNDRVSGVVTYSNGIMHHINGTFREPKLVLANNEYNADGTIKNQCRFSLELDSDRIFGLDECFVDGRWVKFNNVGLRRK
jgi:hypothetical protein